MTAAAPLAGQVAIVTGGGRGIGRAIAARLAGAGAGVAIASRKLEVLEATARELAGLPGRVHPVACHVGRAADLSRLVAETERALGPVTLLVNNGATNVQTGPSLEATDEQFDKMIEVNLKAAFRLVNLVVPGMIARGAGGAILNVASVSGLTPQPQSLLYSMTKAALLMLTRQWAREFGPHRIRVNALAPGLIQTDFSRYLWSDEGRRREFAGDQPLPWLGQPDEVAAAAYFLLSGEGSFVTGHTLVVDGGALA